MTGFSLRRLFGRVPEPPTPRDRHLPAAYWTRWIAWGRDEIVRSAAEPEASDTDPMRRVYWQTNLILRQRYYEVDCLYAGGYPLEEVATAWRDARTHKFQLDDDYRRLHPEWPQGLFGWTLQDQYAGMLADMALDACLIDSPGALAEDIARCTPAGHDRLFDLVARRLDPARPVADALAFPKRYARLLAAVEASPSKQAAALLEAVRTWKRGLPYQGAPPPGATTTVDGAYKGYFCWEAALVARVLGVDDSAVRDHPNYPADAVAWRRSEP